MPNKGDSSGLPSSSNGVSTHEDEDEKHKPQTFKHYQIKLFDDILDKSIDVVSYTANIPEKDPAVNDSGVQLFRRASAGMVFDHIFRKQLHSVAADRNDKIAAARAAYPKSSAKLEARGAAAKMEEERVA
ncbi:hypothetical protein CDL12_15654 [Handroanthus impetiginosus]|uniref:Uncharacterized protein n=1 Tax=Handroanthus impetiginosus TaxID=429701 RepID=A0A2G9H2M6_9LAMI|nr:hypothetical protein CDL12_15654 [Handroanthus impetiginosus]